MKNVLVALGAGIIATVVILGILAVQAKRGPDPQVETRTLGPANETFTFIVEPAGRASPANDCVVCHSLKKDGPMRSAPSLWGIVDAPKARSDWFGYSVALRKKGGVWSEDELHAYLAEPRGFMPGTTKILPPIKDESRRQKLIAYLKTLHD